MEPTRIPPSTGVARRMLYVWAESPEARRQSEGLFSRDQWAILPTAQTGEGLVSLVRSTKPAAIVFHYHDGLAAVLDSLRLLEAQCPECPRLVVCAEADQKVFRSWPGVPPTVLLDTAAAEEIGEKVARTIALHHWLAQPALRAVLPRLRTIPTLPAAHHRMVETLRDPNHSGDELARLMSQDISLTANLFKIANSAAFGLSQPVKTVDEAITQLGVERLQALVMSAWAFQFIDEKTCRGFNPQQEWEHALAVASATRELSAQVEVRAVLAETAFTAGILHDLGKLLLAANAPEAYGLILAEAAESNQPIWRVEQEGMGFTHAELGACMLGVWGVGLPVVEAVAWHHRPADAASSQPSPLMLVHLADCKVRNLPPDPDHAKLAVLA